MSPITHLYEGSCQPPARRGNVSTATGHVWEMRPSISVSTHRWFPLDHSELRPQPIGNPARDLCRRFVGDREYRTDIDFAKHVAVGRVGPGWAEHEIRVP